MSCRKNQKENLHTFLRRFLFFYASFLRGNAEPFANDSI
ncbi:UNVERIFIED_ORG: hypothetical protein J2806_000649 [Kosakonia oryzae]|nr:hypothetical protein [Kosakonia oryzae]